MVQAAQLAITLALEVVDDQGVLVPGMLALEFYVLDMLPCLSCTWYAFPVALQPFN